MLTPTRGLYLVTPDLIDVETLLAALDAAIGAGAVMVQFRQKLRGDVDKRACAEEVLALCRRRGVPMLVNDDCALAEAIGADGVHLGRDDLPIAEARRRLGVAAIIGASCYDSLTAARRAAEAGASYVAFGSMFPSSTKPHALRASLDLLRRARAELALPICAIGGIRADNAGPLLAAGADLLAVISDVFGQPAPGPAAARYRELFQAT